LHQKSTSPSTKGGKSEQQQEAPIPPSVKKVGDRNNKQILHFHISPKGKPIEKKNYWQENGKSGGVE
jgi:hypothetical protein